MPDPRLHDRYRREFSAELANAVATLVVAEDGGPIRTIIDGRSKRARTLFTSCKGVAFATDSKAERALAFVSEADPAVKSMLGQPHRLEFVTSSGVRHVYIPDLRRDLRTGAVEIIECKADDLPDKRGPAYARKLELAAQVYALIGWGYRKLTLAEIAAEPRFTALTRIARDGLLRLRPTERFIVTDLLNARGPMALGALADAVAPPPRGQSVVHHLACHGVVSIDLRRRLSRDRSIVSLFNPNSEPLV